MVSQEEARSRIRRTFRDFTRSEMKSASKRPKRIQLWIREDGPDQRGHAGEVCPNPERDLDRSLTKWLIEDFRGHIDTAPPVSALDYLREAFDQVLSLPAWMTIEPPESMPCTADNSYQLMVTGRVIPTDQLDTLVDAAEKLLAAAPPDWTSPVRPIDLEAGMSQTPQTSRSSFTSRKPALPSLLTPAVTPALHRSPRQRGGCSPQMLARQLEECRGRLVGLRARIDHMPITAAILRQERKRGKLQGVDPFYSVFPDRPYLEYKSVGHGETYSVAFYALHQTSEINLIRSTLTYIEAITCELVSLLGELPTTAREYLRLPEGQDWWRIVFHLGWHFPRAFLRPARCRLLKGNGRHQEIFDETFAQLYGTAGLSDILPGLIFSNLQEDLCSCSEAAISVILDALERKAVIGPGIRMAARALSEEERKPFDELRAQFQAETQLPVGVNCVLLRLADSFESSPATQWANVYMGGQECRQLTLSRLNDKQELAQIHGFATQWFCELAERAGQALPSFVPDLPILFSDSRLGFGGPTPVVYRGAVERWIGFVFATLKRYAPQELQVRWETDRGPVRSGQATFTNGLFAASLLALDLAGLTTFAEEAAIRARATCSPFSVPSMEEVGLQFNGATPPAPQLTMCTLGQLVEWLRRFGEDCRNMEEQIQEQPGAMQRGARAQHAMSVTEARAHFQAVTGFTGLRDWVRAQWDQELSFAVGQRLVNTLVERSNGGLTTVAAENLPLEEVVPRLLTPLEATAPLETPEPAVGPATPGKAAPEIDLEVQAIALLFKHRNWSIQKIADYLKVDRKTPYRWEHFREVAERIGTLKPRGPKDRLPPRGHKSTDGQVEAYSDDEEE
jgi:hypothetical protein